MAKGSLGEHNFLVKQILKRYDEYIENMIEF
jgi:hypothetical protein